MFASILVSGIVSLVSANTSEDRSLEVALPTFEAKKVSIVRDSVQLIAPKPKYDLVLVDVNKAKRNEKPNPDAVVVIW